MIPPETAHFTLAICLTLASLIGVIATDILILRARRLPRKTRHIQPILFR